jgi:hypothetical protein
VQEDVAHFVWDLVRGSLDLSEAATRWLANVQGEWGLLCTAHHLLKWAAASA